MNKKSIICGLSLLVSMPVFCMKQEQENSVATQKEQLKVVIRTTSGKTNFDINSDYSNRRSRFLLKFSEESKAKEFEESMTDYVWQTLYEHKDPKKLTFYYLNIVLTDDVAGRELYSRMLYTQGIRGIWEFDFC